MAFSLIRVGVSLCPIFALRRCACFKIHFRIGKFSFRYNLIDCAIFACAVDSLVLVAMREKFRRGVISGSGAGAVILSGGALPISGTSYGTLVYAFLIKF